MILSSNVSFNIAPLGDNVTLQCTNNGGPNNTYAWRKDGLLLISEASDTLNLTSVNPSSAGLYNCTVSNPAGSDSSTIPLFGKIQCIKCHFPVQ